MKLRTYDVIVAAQDVVANALDAGYGDGTLKIGKNYIDTLIAALAKIPSPLPVKMTKTEIRDRMEPETLRRKISYWDDACENCGHPFHAHHISGGQGFCTYHTYSCYTENDEDCDCGGFQPE